MSYGSILSSSGQIQAQYLPTGGAPSHPYVENPMVANLDCGGFQLSDVGIYAPSSTVTYTQAGGLVTSPQGPVAQPLDAGLYYMTVNIKYPSVGALPADLYYDVRNQAGSIIVVQNIITAAQQTTLDANCSVSHIFQVPISYSAYINFDGIINGAINLGNTGALSMVLTKIF